MTTIQGFKLLQREKNSHKSEAIVQYTPKTLNRTQMKQRRKERYQIPQCRTLRTARQWRMCETVAFGTKKKRHFTKPNKSAASVVYR